MNLTEKTKEKLSQVTSVILRKKFGEGHSFEIVSAVIAFEDILKSDRWGSESYVEESDSLNEFIEQCSSAYEWRKTENYVYKYLDISKIHSIFDELDKIKKINTKLTITPGEYWNDSYE